MHDVVARELQAACDARDRPIRRRLDGRLTANFPLDASPASSGKLSALRAANFPIVGGGASSGKLAAIGPGSWRTDWLRGGPSGFGEGRTGLGELAALRRKPPENKAGHAVRAEASGADLKDDPRNGGTCREWTSPQRFTGETPPVGPLAPRRIHRGTKFSKGRLGPQAGRPPGNRARGAP